MARLMAAKRRGAAGRFLIHDGNALVSSAKRVQIEHEYVAAEAAVRSESKALFGDHYRAIEAASFAYTLSGKAAMAPWMNRRGTEFITLLKGEVVIGGIARRVGEIIRVDPGEIVEIITPSKCTLVSHVFPYRKLLNHIEYQEPNLRRPGQSVSIVVIAKDIEHHVSQCLQSCIRQTHQNVQVVVVVDASQDETLEKCFNMARFDRRIQVLDARTPLGANGARKLGLQHARGDFTMMVDGDDWLNEDAVEILLAVAKSQSSDCVCFGFDHHSDATRKMWDPVLPTHVFVTEGPLFWSKEPETALGVSTLNHTVWMYFFASHLNEVAKRSLLDISLYEDLPYFLSLIEHANRTCVANFVLYHYRRDRLGQSTENWTGVPAGLKLACLEIAVVHSLDHMQKDKWFFQAILLYKIERIILYEIDLCRKNKDVEAAISWERYWLRLTAKFPADLVDKLGYERTRRRFKISRSPLIKSLNFNRNARMLRRGKSSAG